MIEQFESSRQRDTNRHSMEQLKAAWGSMTTEQQKSAAIHIIAWGCMRHLSNDTLRSRLEDSGIRFNTLDIALLRSVIWLHLVSCHRLKYQPSSRNQNISPSAPGREMTRFDRYESNFTTRQKEELDISRFLFYRAVDQICYKIQSGLRFQAEQKFKKMVTPELSEERGNRQQWEPLWTMVNHLEKSTPKKTLCSVFGNSSMGHYRLRKIKDAGFKTLYTTNAVSTTGCIGAPIHYVNATQADFELFRQSIPTQIAFALFAANHEVIWVSSKAVLVRLRSGEEKAQQASIALTARIKATEIFQTASVSNSGFHDWLARGLCTCQVIDDWPNGNVICSHDKTLTLPEFKTPSVPDMKRIRYRIGDKIYSFTQKEYEDYCFATEWSDEDIVWDKDLNESEEMQ